MIYPNSDLNEAHNVMFYSFKYPDCPECKSGFLRETDEFGQNNILRCDNCNKTTVKETKKMDKQNIRDYYKLTSKILKSGVLSDRESAHLAVMFSDAAFNCSKKDRNIDGMFVKLLEISTKASKSA